MCEWNPNVEQELLDRYLAGGVKLQVNDDQDFPTIVTVSIWHGGHGRWKTKQPDQHPKSGRYRFRFGPRRQTVYRNRLVWMLYNGMRIPEGSVVDHKDTNPLNDHPSNLVIHSREESDRQGYDAQCEKNWIEVASFFDGLAGVPF